MATCSASPLLFLLFFFFNAEAQIPGFLSIDCGGSRNYTDNIGLEWVTDNRVMFGKTAEISIDSPNRTQYKTLRYFPPDAKKYCYTLNVDSRRRYLLRATFLYGNFDNSNVYPKFDISVGATHWSTVVISDASEMEVRELIFLASTETLSVCLSNATTGVPFISTLELRQFNGSMYYTDYENQYFLSVSARINFGADNTEVIRYPDDPFDRLWVSDSIRKANFLVDVASGTSKISTRLPIDTNRNDRPPEKVMQTAVVGRNGSLTYRLNLEGFPGFGWAFSYFAELEDLASDEVRKFRLTLPGEPEYSKASVNVKENAQGRFRLYEPGYPNISLPYVLSFAFIRTSDSSRGPILNAMEISKYIKMNSGSQDAATVATLQSRYLLADWAQEGGDPCLPVQWSWVKCSTDVQPKLISINLSRRNLTGNIPLEFTKLDGLVELWLDGNALSGPIPDFTGCINLKIIHLENNQLIGSIPRSFASLPSLKELYIQNNQLSGSVPSGLSDIMVLNYSGNPNLHSEENGRTRTIIIVCSIVGGIFVIALVVALVYCCFCMKKKEVDKEDAHSRISMLPAHSALSTLPALPSQIIVGSLSDAPTEAAHSFTLAELAFATSKFERKIGSGGFGAVYYGKLNDGKEIAVKVLSTSSFQGKREFLNEVALLSRIHHRNLVAFLGYCQEEGKSILVYEYMHNGTLKEKLYGHLTRDRSVTWIKRLEIAEDAAKGIEYLHTGCVPSIIHRDLKTSNILLDKHLRAKVSDFGLSKVAVDGSTHVSSIVRGTVGYLDPEYYISQQLTDKSDVYSFGVILLELISSQEAISNESFGVNCRNIVQWAKTYIESGDIQHIVDPTLCGEYDLQSVWKIAEKAILCVQPQGRLRPSISEVLKEIQEAISIEKGLGSGGEENLDMTSRTSRHSSINLSSLDIGLSDTYMPFDDSVLPTAR